VYGATESGNPFNEITQTLIINANGGLIELATPVAKGQRLFIANMKTGDEIACDVATLGSHVGGKAQVGIRFAEPSPHFWGLAFPPEDWDSGERKRPSPQKR
jgi:hypothetical protein